MGVRFRLGKKNCQIQAFEVAPSGTHSNHIPSLVTWDGRSSALVWSGEIKKKSLPSKSWQSFSSFTIETIKDSRGSTFLSRRY